MQPQTTNAPGKTILLVIGILYLVFSGFGLIGAAFLNEVGSAFDQIGREIGMGGLGGDVNNLAFMLFLSSGFGVLLGILSIAWRRNVGKAQILLFLGIAAAALEVISSITNDGSFMFLVIGLVLPVLLVVGAFMNKKAAA